MNHFPPVVPKIWRWYHGVFDERNYEKSALTTSKNSLVKYVHMLSSLVRKSKNIIKKRYKNIHYC